MSLTIRLRNQFDNDTVHAVVRADAKSHAALKKFMHCKDEIAIRFPMGVKMCSRGRGWYRIDASNEHRAVEKLMFAVKLVKRFLKEEEEAVEAQIKLLAPIMRDPGLRIVSFSNAHSEGEYGYMGAPTPPAPPSANKLNALVAKFQRT